MTVSVIHPLPLHTQCRAKPSREGEIDAPSHIDAIAHAMQLITDPEVGCLTDLNELDGVGFKTILAKGYWRSARITEDVIAALEASTPLAPMHNPFYIASISCLSRTPPDHATCCCF